MGNSCYINSIVQALANFKPVVKFFSQKDLDQSWNQSSKSCGEVASEFSILIKDMVSASRFKVVAPRKFKAILGKYNNIYDTNEQQDGAELMGDLLRWLADDLRRVSVEVGRVYEIHDEEIKVSEEAWKKFKTEDSSFITDTFHGQFRFVNIHYYN